MQLYYSGTQVSNTPQISPLQSLGGLISNSLMPNASLNALFPQISRSDIKNNITDVRLIVLTNTTGASVTNIRIYTTRGDYSSYSIAAVSPATNSFGNPQFELLSNGNCLPFQATLASREGVDNAISIESLANGVSIGIWIQRIIDLSEFTVLDGISGIEQLSDTDLIALLQANTPAPPSRTDQGQLIIAWT